LQKASISLPSSDAVQPQDRLEGERAFKKPVSTLAMSARSHPITVLGRKTYNVLLCLAQEELRKGKDVEVHRAPLSEVVHLLKYDSNDLELIKKHFRAMLTTTVEWQSPTTGEGDKWIGCSLLAQASIEKVRGQVWISWAFAPALRHELLNPRVFARMNLAMIAQLRTYAAVCLYEVANRYKNVGQSPRKEWRWWHDPITGRQPDAARLEKLDYSFFKRDVLKPAIAEINAVTDLQIELKEHKQGRFIHEIQFLIRPNEQRQLALEQAPEKADLESVRQARELGISDARVEKIVDTFGAEALATALPDLRRRIETPFPEPVRDPERYLLSLMPGHAERATARAVAAEARNDPESRESKEIQGRRREAYETAWRASRLKSIEDDFRKLSAPEQSQIAGEILRAMEELLRQGAGPIHPQMIKRLKTDGWTHDLVKRRFLTMYAEATIGKDWNVPTDQDLLTVAAQLGDAGVH